LLELEGMGNFEVVQLHSPSEERYESIFQGRLSFEIQEILQNTN